MISLNISIYEVIEALKETGRITTNRVEFDEYYLKYLEPENNRKNSKWVDKYKLLRPDDDSIELVGYSRSLEDCNCEDD